MKRIISAFCIVVLGATAMAQDIMTVHKKDGTKETVLLSKFSSVSFDTTNEANPTMVVTKSDNTQLTVGVNDLDHTSFDVELDYSQFTAVPYRYGDQFKTEGQLAIREYIINKLRNFQESDISKTNYAYHYVDMGFASAGYANMSLNTFNDYLNDMYPDYPEMFHAMNAPRYDGENETYYDGTNNLCARITKVYTPGKYAEDMAQIDAYANQMLQGIKPSMSDYEKVRLLHDRFLRHTLYGDMSSGDGGNMRGPFINQRAVCEGLSRGFLYLCQRAEVKCVVIIGSEFFGMTTDAEGNEVENLGNHAWNFVEVDGKWYQVDLTPDISFYNYDGKIQYTGFLRGKQHFDSGYRMYYAGGADQNYFYPTKPTLADEDYFCDRTSVVR